MGLRRVILPTVVLLGGCLAAPGAALGQSMVAASCPGPTGGANVTPGTARMAQTFTSAITGKVTAATFRLTRNVADGSGDYIVKVGSVDGTGTPTGTVLGGGVIPDAAVPAPSTDETFTATFTDLADVSAGQTYALIISRPAAPGGTGMRLTLSGPECPGSMFKSDNPGAPFVDQMNDLIFTVSVEPPPPIVPAAAVPAVATPSKKCKKGKKLKKVKGKRKCVRKKKKRR